MRKYPIGLQSFRKIREGGFVYVDKTEIIHRMVTTGDYYFLSRPRRFGKSLLVDTLQELFEGSRELFEGLWIAERWDWSQTNPVIRISFSSIGVGTQGFEAAVLGALRDNAERLGVELTEQTYDQQFKELIKKVSAAGKAVVLIDEYDKPLIDYLNDPAGLEEHRRMMKAFYSVLKDADEHIRFLLLTGVSRFSKVSIFSDLNHLRDITMNGQFDDLVGITQPELERDFVEEIAGLQADDTDILRKIRQWYNGYSWGGEKRVYNPFSILNYMADHAFNNYWFETGTPTFFTDMIRHNPTLEFPEGQLEVGPEGILDLLDQQSDYGGPASIDPVTIMFQTGYLTVKGYDAVRRTYTLDYPNLEVRESTQLLHQPAQAPPRP